MSLEYRKNCLCRQKGRGWQAIKKTVFLLSLFAVVFFMACGGGGGGSTSSNAGGWSGNRNAAGFPDVVGMYSCNVGAGSAVCTDGSSGAYAPLAMNIRITQNNNQLTLFNTSSTGPPPGATILWSDNFDGNIELDADFILDQNIIMRMAAEPGNFTLKYTFTGSFNPSGWAGDYQLNVYNDFYRVSCTYSSQFTGEKVAQDRSAIAQSGSTDRSPGEVKSFYDFTDMTSLLGI